jgi:hypothetical protein
MDKVARGQDILLVLRSSGMWRQAMLPSVLHGCHFDTISSFSIKNFAPDIFDHTSYVPPTVRIINAAFCIYRFRMILTVNRDYFLKLHQPDDTLKPHRNINIANKSFENATK